MAHTIECRRCHRTGFVRLETVVKGAVTERHYQCGSCTYSWGEPEPAADADRRKRTMLRADLPYERRRRA